MDQNIEELGINVIRGLAVDAPHAARSGHQGTALALAPLAHVLFTRVLKYDADDATWPDRDRFVLSAGHASILLYSMLHLTGISWSDSDPLSLEDLRQFRQFGSLTPGHPEAGHTAGVEVTTGPLGQGLANAVGMAIGEANLRARFGAELCDHYTYVIAGDGCLSEGVSHEAASLAGHLGLGRLIVIYDDNEITIDGVTGLALSDDAGARFAAYGWQVIEAGEIGEDLDELERVLLEAKAEPDRPTLIRLRTHIGYPSPSLTDSHEAHGLPFGDAEITELKAVLGLPDTPFYVPDEVLRYYRAAGLEGAGERQAWQDRLDAADDDLADQWATIWSEEGDEGWVEALPSFNPGDSVATRVASQKVVDALTASFPQLIGGSADLTGNTGCKMPGEAAFGPDSPEGRQIYFGVREHAMGSILVGLAHHGGFLPFGGTFLVFSDYMRPAARLAALSDAKAIFVWTHDSLGVGEDGPTHQPVEHIMSLRLIPGLQVLRPADATETVGAWQAAIDYDGPSALILSRQNLPVLDTSRADGVARGAYILADHDDPDVTLVGTGSEVSVCVAAAKELANQGINARVVSMPCWERFDALPIAQQDTVLDPTIATVSVEAGVTIGWERYAAVSVGVDEFGASAPGHIVLEELGINVAAVVEATVDLLAELSQEP